MSSHIILGHASPVTSLCLFSFSFFFFPPLSLSLSEPPLPPFLPCISLPHCGELGVTLTLGSQTCIYLLYPRVCSMTTRCYWTVTLHVLFEPSHRRVPLLTQNQQGYSHIVYRNGSVVGIFEFRYTHSGKTLVNDHQCKCVLERETYCNTLKWVLLHATISMSFGGQRYGYI